MRYVSEFTTSKEQDKESQGYKVRRYYEASLPDYLTFWTNRKDLAMHFGYYDKTVKNERQAHLKMIEVLSQFAGFEKGKRIVDAGCGYGHNSCLLSEMYDAEVLGLNIVPFQISMAKDRAKELGLANKVDFENRDFEDTGLPQNSFDYFWALESSVHAKDRTKLIGEAYRMLKPGGKMMIGDYFYRSEPKLTQAEIDEMEPWRVGQALHSFCTEEEMRTDLEAAGFKDIQFIDVTENVKKSFKRLERMCRIMLVLGRISLKFGWVSQDRYNNASGALNSALTLWKGLWQYKAVTASK